MAEENGAEEEKKSPKKSPMKLIIIIVAVLLLAGGGFAGWMILSGDEEDGAGPVAESEAITNEAAPGISFALDTFVVNLNDPGGKRYLKTKIELEYTDEALVEELKQRLPQLRDVILLLLSSKTLDDIQGIDGKIALRRELISRVNQILKKGKIRSLYFTQFVIQ